MVASSIALALSVVAESKGVGDAVVEVVVGEGDTPPIPGTGEAEVGITTSEVGDCVPGGTGDAPRELGESPVEEGDAPVEEGDTPVEEGDIPVEEEEGVAVVGGERRPRRWKE